MRIQATKIVDDWNHDLTGTATERRERLIVAIAKELQSKTTVNPMSITDEERRFLEL